MIDTSLLYFSNSFDSCIIISHDSKNAAYDAVFDIWREDPIPTSTLWHTLQSEFLDLLITSFETHESFPHARTSQRFS